LQIGWDVVETTSSIGRVKWFNDQQGFGIIVDRSSGAEVYVHHTAISEPGYTNLREGQTVRFEALQCSRGIQAASVRKIK